MELQLILVANMPKHAYNNVVNLLKHICTYLHGNQQQLQSHYTLSKGIPRICLFKCTYKYDLLVKPTKPVNEDEEGTMLSSDIVSLAAV